jgi:hypothetical protein
MEATAAFCRLRQPFCHGSRTIPQVGLLYSTAGHYRQSPVLFRADSSGARCMTGLLHSLLDSQFSVDVRSEHHLHGSLRDWPVLVVPAWDYLEPVFRDELLEWVRQGGRLMVVGPAAAGFFLDQLEVRKIGDPVAERPIYLAHEGWLAGQHTPWQRVAVEGDTEVLGWMHEADDLKSPSWPAATLSSLARGRIAVVWLDSGSTYDTARTSTARDFLAAVLRSLFPRPMVRVTGSRTLDVSLQQGKNRVLIHLINTSGPHEDEKVFTIGEIAPVGPLEVRLQLDCRPVQVTLEPGAEDLAWRFREGQLHATVPKVEIHRTVVVRI